MHKSDLYQLLEIEEPQDFEYYENVETLLEGDEYIEQSLIHDLLSEIDMNIFGELTDSYFAELIRKLPEEEMEFYLTLLNIRRKFSGIINTHMTDADFSELANEIVKFKKWFTQDSTVVDCNTSEKICPRDAIYNFYASKFGGKKCDYEFLEACTYDIDGYDFNIGDLIAREQESDD